jgi:hypothetical protein
MRTLSVVRFILSAGVAAALLGGCGALPVSPSNGQDNAQSWMRPSASKTLLYVDNDKTNRTYVYEYPSGKLVGSLAGFYTPRGMCVDQKGDVYITNYDYGLMMEYAHGGTKPISVYEDPGQNLVGCSISATGDVAATAADNICIWKGGIASDRATCVTNTLGCGGVTYGYDHVGNLVGLGWSSHGVIACMIPAGKTTMEQLSTSKITLRGTGRGTSWDGEYIALGAAVDVNNVYKVVIQPAKLSGTTLIGVGPAISLLDDCTPAEPSGINTPFFFGEENVTAASTTRATRVTGPNGGCLKSGKGVADVWNYPKTGSEPILRIPAGYHMSGDAVSIEE